MQSQAVTTLETGLQLTKISSLIENKVHSTDICSFKVLLVAMHGIPQIPTHLALIDYWLMNNLI